MIVYIGNYRDWIGPYQIAEKLCFWTSKVKNEDGIEEFPEWVDKFGDWLSKTPLLPICNWIHEKKKRIVYVHINEYDTWNMDTNLSPIILPMLKQLRATKHGAPHVKDEDVPEELRSTKEGPKENDWDTGELHFERWDWVLDEMIWAFEQNLIDWEDQFHTGTIDLCFQEEAETGRKLLVRGPNHTGVFDNEGYQKHLDRINNGTRLFGVYYSALWD